MLIDLLEYQRGREREREIGREKGREEKERDREQKHFHKLVYFPNVQNS